MTAPLMTRALRGIEADDRRARRRRFVDRAIPYVVVGAGTLVALVFAAVVAVLVFGSS